MAIRLVAGSLLFLAFPVLAQQQQQDPDKPQATPEQQAKELTAEKERLQREIQYAKERVGNSKLLLREKMSGSKQAFRSIDAGTNMPVVVQPPAAPQMTRAKLATSDQLGDFPNDTIALINNRPLTQSSLDRLTNFLRTGPGEATEQQHAERAMYELLRIEAVTAAFEENVAAERAATAMAALHDGKPVADVVKEYGTCQGAAADGKVEIMHNSIFGPMVEMMAFTTKEGGNSVPFRTANGIMIFRAEKLEKGAQPALDKMVGYAVQVPYTGDDTMLQKAHLAINMGQVQIVVKDEKTMALLPPMFRPLPVTAEGSDVAPGKVDDATNLKQVLEQLSAQIKQAAASTDPTAKEQLKTLEAQQAALQARLKELQGDAVKAPTTPVIDIKVVQAAMQEVQEQMSKLATATDDASKAKLKELQQRYSELKMQLRGGAPGQPPSVHAVPEPKK